MDKSFWQSIIDADYALPDGYTTRDLVPELIGYLGSTDPQLRDIFAYGIMNRWINRQIVQPADLHPLIEPFTANLRHGLSEQNTDSVFLRSFSVLMLAATVYYDNHKQPFLSDNEVHQLLEAVLVYFAAERDVRGCVEGKGWAHAVAHTADLLDEFALSRYATEYDLERILDALAMKVMTTQSMLLFNEDDRMSFAALSALKREMLSQSYVQAWITKLGQLPASTGLQKLFSDPVCHSAYVNTKNFLRSLYVRLLDEQLAVNVQRFALDVRDVLQHFQKLV
jgi:hypothetical protein